MLLFFLWINLDLFSFECLALAPCHLIGKRLFAVFLYETDARRAVGLEQESEHLRNEI